MPWRRISDDDQDDPWRSRAGSPARARARRVLTGLRRRVLARRRLLAAALLGIAVLAALRAVVPPPPATTAVVTAAADLPAGTLLARGDLDVRRLPPAAVPDGAVRPDAARGRTLASPVRRGEALTDARLAGPGLAAGYPGRVAVPVRVPDPAVARLLRVGDEVEVLAVDPGGGEARTVAVARVAGLPGPASSGEPAEPPGRLVLLAATEESARALSAAAVRDYLTLMWTG